MSLSSSEALGKAIASVANSVQNLREDVVENSNDQSMILVPLEPVVVSMSAVMVKKIYASDSFVLDHPVLGELDSSTLRLDGGYSDETINNDAVSYYKCDVSGSFPDSVGSNDGVITGATYTSSGLIGGAYDFNGTDNKIEKSSFMNVGSLTAITLNVWFKTSGWTGDYPSIFALNSESSSETLFLRVRPTDANGNLQIGYEGSGTNTYLSSGSSQADDNWHMGTLTLTDDSKAKMYLDGTYIGETTANIDLDNLGMVKWNMGNSGVYGHSDTFFDGLIDEVGIWSRVLSSSEVSELYNGGSGRQLPYTSSGTVLATYNS